MPKLSTVKSMENGQGAKREGKEKRMFLLRKNRMSIQYVGKAGVSAPCRDAILNLIQNGARVAFVKILTAGNHHAFLLWLDDHTPEVNEVIAVKTGFSSGYTGEGPKILSYVLELLERHGAEIHECTVSSAMLDRLDNCALRESDLASLGPSESASPSEWRDYVSDKDAERGNQGTLWTRTRPVIPFALVDPRLFDLAIGFFEDPDARLVTAYRRLEEAVRARIGGTGFGKHLFTEAFDPKKGQLTWKDATEPEVYGRLSVYTGVYAACRNPRAHRNLQESVVEAVGEFLLLNQLFRYEREAVPREVCQKCV
jgi:hypothetical protein